MATTRTDGGDPSLNVVAQMRAEKKRRQNQPKPKTVISEGQSVEGNKEQGGPNPNDEVRPPEFRRSAEATEVPEAAQESPDSDPQPSEGVEDLGEGNGSSDQSDEDVDRPDGSKERPDGRFGSKNQWYAFRIANGYTEDELEGLGRSKLRDLDDR